MKKLEFFAHNILPNKIALLLLLYIEKIELKYQINKSKGPTRAN